MSNEMPNMQDQQTNRGDATGPNAGEDLSAALGSGGETEFVAAEEKKPVVTQGMLYLLLLLAVGGGMTYWMYKRQGPDAAAAAQVSAESQKAQETINTFLASGPNGMKMMEEMLRNTQKVVQQFLEYPSVTQVPLSDLHTNPFRLKNKGDGATAEKPTEDEARKQREAERQAAIKASQNLNLQSIIHSGTRKACMINNAMYSEGQQLDQFLVEKINPGSVIVKTGAYRFELKMQK
jgi:hypothetical protein